MADVYDRIVDHLRAHSAAKVFDIGSGDGQLGLRLMDAGFKGQYQGLDRDTTAIIRLKDRGLSGQEGDLRWYDGHNYRWDTVVMKDMLEHFSESPLLSRGILLARRVFIFVTKSGLYDSLSLPQCEEPAFNVDDILTLANNCSFQLHHFEMVGRHSILVFTRKKKR